MSKLKWPAIPAIVHLVGILGTVSWVLSTSRASSGGEAVTVYKTPTCGCCTKWAERLSRAGFAVETVELRDLARVKTAHGLPERLASCHTALVGGYVVEGHVPIADIERLLRERPAISGLAVPGMPIGSPGMEGPNPEPYEVFSFDATGVLSVFASHGPGV